jgi:hypothetical protein
VVKSLRTVHFTSAPYVYYGTFSTTVQPAHRATKGAVGAAAQVRGLVGTAEHNGQRAAVRRCFCCLIPGCHL